MGPLTKQLAIVLSRQVEILAANGERNWKNELAKCLSMIQSSDFTGIERLLGMYGGMGSLNDLVLGRTEADEEFNKLRSQAYDLAVSVRHAQ